MQVKLTKETEFDGKMVEVGSIVEVDDSIGKSLIEGESAVEHKEEVEKKEIEKKVQEIEATQPRIEVKRIENPKMRFGEVIRKLYRKELPSFEMKTAKDTYIDLKSICSKAVTGLNETTAADGGNLVDHQLVGRIFGFAMQGAVIAPKCESLPVPANANGLKIPYLDNSGSISRTATPRGYWLAEGAQKTATKFAFGQHDLGLGKLAFYVPMTDEIMEDVTYLESWVIQHIRGKIAWMIDDAILNLSVATSGMMGVFDAGSAAFLTTPIAHAAPWTGNIMYGVISGVMPSLRGGSEWYMSNSTWQNICGDLGGGTTTSTVPVLDVGGMKLGGYPVNVMEQMAVFGGAANGSVLFGNFGEGYKLGVKGDIKMDISKDIRFDYDETVLRFVVRILGAPVVREQTLPDTTVVAAFSTTS